MRTPVVLAVLLMSEPALAHAMLEHASPAAGAQVRPAPRAVVLQFSERLEPAFSRLKVQASGGASVAAAANVTGTVMQAQLKPLSAGSYKVVWHAVSVDTHVTDGSFTFTVKP